MNDIRIKVAAGLLAGVVSVLAGVDAHAATATATRYQCNPRQSLVVSRSGDRAVVEFIDRTYELRRKRSSIGETYISPTAALVIDGPSAVFVAQDRLQLGSCVKATRVAFDR